MLRFHNLDSKDPGSYDVSMTNDRTVTITIHIHVNITIVVTIIITIVIMIIMIIISNMIIINNIVIIIIIIISSSSSSSISPAQIAGGVCAAFTYSMLYLGARMTISLYIYIYIL